MEHTAADALFLLVDAVAIVAYASLLAVPLVVAYWLWKIITQ